MVGLALVEIMKRRDSADQEAPELNDVSVRIEHVVPHQTLEAKCSIGDESARCSDGIECTLERDAVEHWFDRRTIARIRRSGDLDVRRPFRRHRMDQDLLPIVHDPDVARRLVQRLGIKHGRIKRCHTLDIGRKDNERANVETVAIRSRTATNGSSSLPCPWTSSFGR